MQRDSQKYKGHELTNYLITIISLMAVNPFFGNAQQVYGTILLIFLMVTCIKRRLKLIDRRISIILMLVYLLIAIQSFIYKRVSLAAISVPIGLFYIPYLVCRLLGISYFSYFTKILYFIALFTLPFWFLQSVSVPFDNLMRDAIDWAFPLGWGSEPRSLLFFTPAWDDRMFDASIGIYRNSGLFHEPGAYGIFLNLGIITNTMMTGKFFNRKNILFVFCLLTTLSTAGYITLFVILIAFLYRIRINIIVKLFAILIFIFISYRVYQNEEFLKSKMQIQYKLQKKAAEKNLGKYSGQSGRFFAFYTSLNNFSQHPLFGRGIIDATNEITAGEMNKEASYKYGFIGMFATYGLFFGLYYLRYLYLGFKKIGSASKQSNFSVFASFLAINLALLSQSFFLFSVFVLIFIIGVYSKNLLSIRT